MKDYRTYVEGLANLVERSSDRRRSLQAIDIAPALDGEPSRALRQLISREERRRDGVFFTGANLAKKVTSTLTGQLSETSVITDPACGGGDLLLAAARHLPQKPGLWETLQLWGKNLQGTDIHSEFVQSTKLRLVLQAVALGTERSRVGREQVTSLFPRIRVSDGLVDVNQLTTSTHIVTNPPYSMIPAPIDCDWSSGTVNSAAVFIEFITRCVEPGTRVLAILPDVLRSGSRYVKWRDLINSRLSSVRLKLFGQFSQHADVDVFLLDGLRRRRPSKTLVRNPATDYRSTKVNGLSTVHDKFAVHVGPVVLHRHKKRGMEFPFLTPHNCPPWESIRHVEARRRFRGTVFRPPFVVIRRTSRSDDQYRAVGTIVSGKEEMAVENHLILAIPHSGTLQDCHDLLRLLKSPATSKWLNLHMCCRHLTISSVTSIPWTLETA